MIRVLNHVTQNVFMAGYDDMCRSSLATLVLSMIAGLASATLTAALIFISNNFLPESETVETWWWASPLFSNMTAVIGFLLGFRLSQSLARYWEGAGCAFEITRTLFSAASSFFAFAHFRSAATEEEVKAFKHTIARLVSMLSAMMFTHLEDADPFADEGYEILGMASLSKAPFKVLDSQDHKTELVIQWIKIAVVNSVSTGQLSAPPPILTRAFDEIDRCVAKFSEGEKLTRVPLPAQYAMTLRFILIVHGCVTPAAMINMLGATFHAVMGAVLSTFILWSVHILEDLAVLHSELNEKLRLGCAVRPEDVPALSVPLHIAVKHIVPTASPTRNANEGPDRGGGEPHACPSLMSQRGRRSRRN